MVFDTEAAFEEAVIEKLKAYGWDDAGGVLKYPAAGQLGGHPLREQQASRLPERRAPDAYRDAADRRKDPGEAHAGGH